TPHSRTVVRRDLFGAALAVLAIGFVSPLCAWSSALFSARVVHHGLLVAAAAPLAAYALRRPPKPLGLWPAALAHALLFWIWHSPPAYAAALSIDGLYWVMQFSLFVPALAFWCAVRRSPPLGAAAALLGVMLQMG